MIEENNKLKNDEEEKNSINQNSVKFNFQLKKDTNKNNNNNKNLFKNQKDINEFENCPTNNIIERNERKRKVNLHIYKIILENNKKINNVNQLKFLKLKENVLLVDTIFKDGNCFFRAISCFFNWY